MRADRSRLVAFVIVASLALGCGGIAHRDREVAVDAGRDAADAGERVDRPVCIHSTPHVSSDAGTDASTPGTCIVDGDCAGGATCQSGTCCSGALVGGVCRCGDGPGCDTKSVCCLPRGATSTSPSCVSSLSLCGAW